MGLELPGFDCCSSGPEIGFSGLFWCDFGSEKALWPIFGFVSLNQAQNPDFGLLRHPKRDRIALIGFQYGFGVIQVPKRDGIPLLEPLGGISAPVWDWNLLDLTLSVALGPKAYFRGQLADFSALVRFWARTGTQIAQTGPILGF